MQGAGIVSALHSVPQVPTTTPVSLRISADSSRLVVEGVGPSHYGLVSPVWYWLINTNNCVPILICEYLGSRRQISAPGFPSLMWKAEHTYMKGHENKHKGVHQHADQCATAPAESNAASLISEVRNMFPTGLLTPCISLRKQMISNIFEMFTYQK